METLRYALLANGLLAVMSLAFYALLRRETFFEANRFALWLGLAAALLLPLLELPDWRPQPVRTVMQRTAQVILPKVLSDSPDLPADVTITFPNGRTYPAFPTQQTGFGWTWQLLVMGLYVAGAFGLLLRFSFQIRSLMRLIRHSTHEVYDDFTLVSNELVMSPFSFFGWVVVNPNQHTPSELDQILRHERVHVQARHSVDMVIAELICIVFWFNPAAYLFRRLLHQTLEFSADRAVLSEGIDPKAYQYNLLKVSLLAEQATIMAQFSGSMLRHRISMINRSRSGLWAAGRYVLWAGLLGVMALACRHMTDKAKSPYLVEQNEKVYWIVTPTMTDSAWQQLSRDLWKHYISFNPKILRNRAGQLIRMEGSVSKPNRLNIASDAISVGNKKLPTILPPLGFWYDPETGFHSGMVTSDFPDLLRKTARREQDNLLVAWRSEKNARNRMLSPNPEDVGRLNEFEETQSAAQYALKARNLPETYRAMRPEKLLAALAQKPPTGYRRVLTMNQLLEASFFKREQVMLRLDDSNHLDVYPIYQNARIVIDGKPATLADLRAVHVRQVQLAMVRQRSEFDRVVADDDYIVKYDIKLVRAPNRMKRDSSYYVFSPFYSGDF